MAESAGSRNAELARAVWDAINRRDREAFLALFTEDAELNSVWGSIEGMEPYRGRDGLARWWEGFLMEVVDRYRGQIEQLLSLEDLVLALVQVDAEAKGSGFGSSHLVGQVFTIRDGKIARLDAYRDPVEALAEAAAELKRRRPDAL